MMRESSERHHSQFGSDLRKSKSRPGAFRRRDCELRRTDQVNSSAAASMKSSSVCVKGSLGSSIFVNVIPSVGMNVLDPARHGVSSEERNVLSVAHRHMAYEFRFVVYTRLINIGSYGIKPADCKYLT